jgi:cell division protein FtsZ
MPQIDDLPLPAQKQIRAQRGEAPEPETKRRTLLERLAHFGRHEEPTPAESAARAPAPAPAARSGQPNAIHAEYSKRSPYSGRHAQPLDPQGRVLHPSRPMDDDQLEIPAFLRRQSS